MAFLQEVPILEHLHITEMSFLLQPRLVDGLNWRFIPNPIPYLRKKRKISLPDPDFTSLPLHSEINTSC